jgi:uncharacterized protein
MLVALLVLLASALAALAWHAVFVAPQDLQLSHHELRSADFPPGFDGYRIAILADFHHGPQQPIGRAQRAVALANAQAPDLVVLLGDYGTSEWAARELSRRWYRRMFAELGPVLRELRARDGVVAIIGNHDYYASGDETHAWLQSLGFRVLRNEAMALQSPDGPLRLVGLDDLEEGTVEATTVASLVAGATPTIVLSHHPDGVRFCQHPSVRAVLSGHTHGGQILLPWIGAPVRRSEVCSATQPAGWVRNPHAPLLVSRGIGTQIPLRIGTTPEVIVLTLRAHASPRDRAPRQHPT